MSGIYIPGMEMPKNCWDCPLRNTKPCPCKGYSTALEYVTECHEDCPLVPVPKHGRLIDADALMERFSYSPGDTAEDRIWIRAARRIIIEAPTIIPADHFGDANEMVTDKEGEG